MLLGDIPTTCDRLGDADPLKDPPALYVATIGCVPAASDDVLREAVPALSVTVPSAVAPSAKDTVPVGTAVEPPVALTVADSWTDCPDTDGLADEERATAVPASVTVSAAPSETLAMKLVEGM